MRFSCLYLSFAFFFYNVTFSQTINQQYSIQQQYSVTLNGGNFISGVYYVPPAYRVLDVLKMATDTLKMENISRDIQVDGVSIDILQYLYKNDQTQNPPIRSGMQIFVVFPEKFAVINGDIQNKINKLAIKKNEDLESLFSLLTLNPTADSSYVTLIRGQITTKVLRSDYKKELIENNDFIIVPTLRSKHHPYLVQIRGEVERPGYYPIEHGITRINEIVLLAKPLQSGNVSKVCVYRKIKIDQQQSPRPEVSSGLKNLSSQLVTLCSDSNQTLNDSDIIEIPRVDLYVYVNGYVSQPRALTYKEGTSIKQYIKLAGGFTRAADKINVRVLTSCGVSFQIRDVKKIQPGDIIMVPEASESKWIKTWSPVIGVIGSTASIIAALLNISK